METQIAWRVMAVMFDDGSTIWHHVVSVSWSNTLTSQKEESKLYGAQTQRGIWKEKHDDCDLIVADQSCK